jgi:alpha-galactosidase
MSSPDIFLIPRTLDFELSNMDRSVWAKSPRTLIDRYWNGSSAPKHRSFTACLLWSDDFFYVRFDAAQAELLVVSVSPKTEIKTLGLWDRDVCEIFIAPDDAEPRRYFEFEVAPTGEWVDLSIDSTDRTRKTDTEYRSGMEAFAEIGQDTVTMAMKIPWEAFGKRPGSGDVWHGNLFRCVGCDPDRGYLAWSPTMTEVPNFHVPDRFGKFVFVE